MYDEIWYFHRGKVLLKIEVDNKTILVTFRIKD